MCALRQGLGYSLPARALLAQRRGSGGGPVEPAAAGGALACQRGEEHAGAKQRNPLAPQAGPGGNGAILDGEHSAVGGHDPGRGLAGPSMLGLAARPGVGGMIGPCAQIGAREGVVAVAAQRDTIGAGRSGTAGIGDAFG
jgi:hypothetical protein